MEASRTRRAVALVAFVVSSLHKFAEATCVSGPHWTLDPAETTKESRSTVPMFTVAD